METSKINTGVNSFLNSDRERALFNGNVVTLTWEEFRFVLNHFGNTTKEQFNRIASTFETVTVKLW